MCQNCPQGCTTSQSGRGCPGERGRRGKTGPTGASGATGPAGPTGTVECVCKEYVIDFQFPGVTEDINIGPVRLFPSEAAYIIAYGFNNNNTPTDLSSKNGNGFGEDGLGIWDDICFSVHEIDNQRYVQLDVRDLTKFFVNTTCPRPVMEIGSIQIDEGFEIYGSFIQGEIGTSLFSYNNPGTDPIVRTVDLFNPSNVVNPVIYPFISVRAFPMGDCPAGGDVQIDFIRFFACGPACTCSTPIA